ncbi:MAG: hypothetical protein H7210_00120 [Pyrinomonadaceae bacterium]|nr:hypothetical protein [Phycisphaerales bacterium]
MLRISGHHERPPRDIIFNDGPQYWVRANVKLPARRSGRKSSHGMKDVTGAGEVIGADNQENNRVSNGGVRRGGGVDASSY